MVDAQENSLFLAESRTLRGREGINLWCMPAALTLNLFLFFSSKILLSYLFSYCFFFLILVFYFLVFKFLIP